MSKIKLTTCGDTCRPASWHLPRGRSTEPECGTQDAPDQMTLAPNYANNMVKCLHSI